MKDVTKHLHTAFKSLGARGAKVTNAMLYQALGATDATAQGQIRTRCSEMVRRGVLERVDTGVYVYKPQGLTGRDHDLIDAIWRAVRTASPGFQIVDVSRVSGASLSHATKYMRYLADQGFVKQSGTSGNTRLWRTTTKARALREAPMPPKALGDPFEQERIAVMELVGIFMLRDPYQPLVQRQIQAACQTILERFGDSQPIENQGGKHEEAGHAVE